MGFDDISEINTFPFYLMAETSENKSLSLNLDSRCSASLLICHATLPDAVPYCGKSVTDS